ncbi:hypothetical protein GUJ93_ZPchr0001g32822 [Zizania palustris]|uniref:Protein kinase domain-containing protein n=1 Tax=Zizania palustris TaxID=103762 RepID=A0A8J5V6T8_ZIZPA|nr:hypothetical protein GUJ93_ZPchr0001g32822 [Zizania palustris]
MLINALLLVLLASWPPTASSTVSPLYSSCRSQDSGNITYRSNLRALGDQLATNADSSGFARSSVGSAPYMVHGLVLCRGDFTGSDCTDGLKAAFQDVVDRLCVNAVNATVYYDQYMLHFTGDERALSNLADNAPEWFANNMNQVKGADAAAHLMEKVMHLMNETSDLAASGSMNGGKYATGETWFGEQGVDIVYGLVQCTPDLTGRSAGAASPASSRRCRRTSVAHREPLLAKLSTMLNIIIFGLPCLVFLVSVVLLRPYIVKKIRELLLQRDLVILEREIVNESDERNLVRLLGCCIKNKERILVYEYMPNGSLEDLIFGEETRPNWAVRRHIIDGIAEGLLYIHDYAQACIVHRDLKPSNILLDHEMNPKISDFGIARICLSSVTESNTTTAMGTFGYIAPEYYSQNVYSTRSDVFSFGILVLEIISGKRAVGSYRLSGRSYELRRYAWQLWREERCDELVDPSIGEEYQEMDIIRCIQVALLCVQDSAEDRPTMHDVTTMLSNGNRRLLMPAQPGSFVIEVGDRLR